MDESSDPNFKNCKKEIEKMTLREQDMQKLIKTLKEDIEHLESELQGRDKTIQKLEKENSDLRKTNQELENYKHVGDVTMQDQKKKIGEQEKDIKEMTEKIQEVRDVAELVKNFQTDLQKCVGLIQGNNVLKKKIRELHAPRYVQKSDVAKLVHANVDAHEEPDHRKDNLLRTVKNLERELKDMKETQRVSYIRVMQENVTLGKEINDLRRELKLSRTKVQELEKEKALRLSMKNHPLLSADSKGFAGRKSSGVLQLKPEEETTKVFQLPQIKIKGLMQPQKSTPSSVPSRVCKLPPLRLSR